jgi:hypothetical protein
MTATLMAFPSRMIPRRPLKSMERPTHGRTRIEATAVRPEISPISASLAPRSLRKPGKWRKRLKAIPCIRLAIEQSTKGRVKSRSLDKAGAV